MPALSDMAMSLACMSTDRLVSTIEMIINFISNVSLGSRLIANGWLTHSGKTTMVAENDIRDENQRLLCKGRGTFIYLGPLLENSALSMAGDLQD